MMGEKRWVRVANDWIKAACFRFFCRGGARKSFMRSLSRVDLGGEAGVRQIHASLRENLMQGSQRIRLLDVGSCYNPLVEASTEKTQFTQIRVTRA